MKRIIEKIDLKYVVIALSLILVVILCIGAVRSKRYNNVNKVVVNNNTVIEKKKSNDKEIALNEVIINSIEDTIINEIENNDKDNKKDKNTNIVIKDNKKENNENNNNNKSNNVNIVSNKEEVLVGVEPFEFNTINVSNGVIIRTTVKGSYNKETHIIDSFTITIRYDYSATLISQEELEQYMKAKEEEIGKVLGIEVNTEISNSLEEKYYYVRIKSKMDVLKANYPAEFTSDGLFYYENFKEELSNINYDGDSWKELLI